MLASRDVARGCLLIGVFTLWPPYLDGQLRNATSLVALPWKAVVTSDCTLVDLGANSAKLAKGDDILNIRRIWY